MSVNAAETGAKVLQALKAGRAEYLEQRRQMAGALRLNVLAAAREDELRGRGERGRPGRIERKLRGLTSRRHIARILDAESRVSSSPAQSDVQATTERTSP